MQAQAQAPLVVNLVKRGHYNKWFDRQAANKTNQLYQQRFGQPVTRRDVRALDISHVMWIETDDSEVSGSMMLGGSTKAEPAVYRVQGLAVSKPKQRQGYGTALIQSIDRVLPSGTIVWLCVDKGRDSTEWLVRWYLRMGFELAYKDPSLNYGDREIPMKKIIRAREE